MEPEASAQNQQDDLSPRPRPRDWLWRPWYARLWWAFAALYWVGKLGSYWSQALDNLYTNAFAGYLNIVLYPVTLLMVLGVGFVRAWMEYRGLEWGAPTHDDLFPPLSVGGLRDPYSDPLDPKSGMIHWRHFHPND
jgi:hypothetical protein